MFKSMPSLIMIKLIKGMICNMSVKIFECIYGGPISRHLHFKEGIKKIAVMHFLILTSPNDSLSHSLQHNHINWLHGHII